MNSSKLACLALSVFLSGCNLAGQKPDAKKTELVGLPSYKLSLEDADASYKRKSYLTAVKKYEKLHERFPKDTFVLFKLGNSYNHSDKPDQAIEAYKKALDLDQKMSKSWYNLGVVYMQQSAKVWEEMSENVNSDDPLYEKSTHYSKGLIELIKPKKSE
jgi:tetratricopeptide (TPR) repeat protein